MNREVHVRFWEGLGVRFHRATQPRATFARNACMWDDTGSLSRNCPTCSLSSGHVWVRTPRRLKYGCIQSH
jgi:hypothetical protein